MARYHKPTGLWEATKREPTGKRLSAYGKTPEEAERNLAHKLARLAVERAAPPVQTWPTLAEYFARVYAPTLANHSYKWREQVDWAASHIMPSLGHLQVHEIGRHQVQAFLMERGREERTVAVVSPKGKKIVRKYPPLGRASLGHIRKVLHAVFAMAEADEIVTRNPVRAVELPPVRTKRQARTYTLEEIAKLIEGSKGTLWHRPLWLCALLGLRRGEALGVMAEDLLDGSLHVQRDVEQIGRGVATGPLKTLSSDRWLPLPEPMAMEIRSWGEKGHLVLWRGELVRPDGLTHALPKMADRAGVPRLTVHALRASFNSALAELGCPLEWRRELMGHSQSGVNERAYTRYREERKREWLTRFWEAFETASSVHRSTATPTAATIADQISRIGEI